MAFTLASITNAKITKTTISFLALKDLSNCLNNSLFYYNSSKWLDFGLVKHISSYQNYLLYWL